MPTLSIRSLRKTFLVGPAHSPKRTAALAGVDLDVDEGEIVGVVGSAAAGKTTLLLCAAGLLRCDSGSIHWHGKRFCGGGCLPGLAYVAEMPTYYPFLTVGDVLDCYAARAEVPAARRCRAIELASSRLELSDELNTPVARLGTHVLKRLSIAEALVEESDVILLDATLDGLIEGASLTHRVIRDVARRGVTVIATSRSAGTLAPVATRLLVMEAGTMTGSFRTEGCVPESFESGIGFGEVPLQISRIAERVH